MPQMMPLNWISLMLFFTLIFYFFNNLNFFSFLYNKKKTDFKLKSYKLNWKW
uniref:ATP synthase complex subunit 8 n=2 Tax=Psylliodes TaxID=294691 RepID=A0A3G1GNJ6_9CUCU|nr:ATP synthase F0 subunit 8 [Psylliodes thlaspis]APX39865.1 ATP synthase F0 subunit 8 [Psylliodes cupreus]WNU00262.1 ATP synthase subunit 8 [Psylliodes crambicola]